MLLNNKLRHSKHFKNYLSKAEFESGLPDQMWLGALHCRRLGRNFYREKVERSKEIIGWLQLQAGTG